MNALTASAPATTIVSASGTYVASPGMWGCGEGYRVWTKWAAQSSRHRASIADVATAEQARVLLNALDAKDLVVELEIQLGEALANNVILKSFIDRPLPTRIRQWLGL